MTKTYYVCGTIEFDDNDDEDHIHILVNAMTRAAEKVGVSCCDFDQIDDISSGGDDD